MIKGKDFVFTGLQPWDIALGSNAKDIAAEVSADNRVLYISTPLDYLTYKGKGGESRQDILHRRRVVNGELPVLRRLSGTMWTLDFPFTLFPVNKLPDGLIFDFFNYRNNKRMYKFVNNILKELEFKDYILFIDNDVYRSLHAPALLKPAFSVYYRRDNLVSPYWKDHVGRIEPKICAACDMVAANSIYLADMVRPYNPKAYDVGQGLDLSDYNPERTYPVPEDMKHIPGPVVGYAGWITSLRLDAGLLYEVARTMPEVSFVMVGSEDEYFSKHRLHSLKNVYFLGLKQSGEIPDYIAAFDICMNPQLVNEITKGNYPRKIDEYLSLGKRVIATRTPAMEMFAPYVWNCDGAAEYIRAIREALDDHSAERVQKRIAFAQTHTWKNSVTKIYSHIQDNISLKQRI